MLTLQYQAATMLQVYDLTIASKQVRYYSYVFCLQMFACEYILKEAPPNLLLLLSFKRVQQTLE